MKILAIDTSSSICTVCICEDENVLIELNNSDEKTHSQKLMPMIQDAFDKTNLNLDDIDLLASSLGPGSFTGVRIGISTIKAFSDVKKLPTVGVSSLEGLAYNLNTNGLICSIIDAKNENVYYGLFEFKDSKCNNIIILSTDNINNLINYLNNLQTSNSEISFVGDGAILYQELLVKVLSNRYKEMHFTLDDKNNASSISIAKSALVKFKNGEYGNSNTLIPLYLRKSQAERALEEKNG